MKSNDVNSVPLSYDSFDKDIDDITCQFFFN